MAAANARCPSPGPAPLNALSDAARGQAIDEVELETLHLLELAAFKFACGVVDLDRVAGA